MRTNLTLEDLPGFLELPLVAVLTTLRRDSSVQLSPVWHEWRDSGFNLGSRGGRQDPSSATRSEGRPRRGGDETPLRGVELRTEARLVDRDVRAAVRIATRSSASEGPDYVDPPRTM